MGILIGVHGPEPPPIAFLYHHTCLVCSRRGRGDSDINLSVTPAQAAPLSTGRRHLVRGRVQCEAPHPGGQGSASQGRHCHDAVQDRRNQGRALVCTAFCSCGLLVPPLRPRNSDPTFFIRSGPSPSERR
jgi:hypothetical protein